MPGVVPPDRLETLEAIPTWNDWDPDQDRWYYESDRWTEPPGP